VLIAGGSGLAPILSIARGAVSDPRLAGRTIHVFHGVRSQRDLCAGPELATLPGFGQRVLLEEVVSDPQAEGEPWAGFTGFVHEHARKLIGDRWAGFEYYFAGPPPMAEAVQRMLIDARVPFPQVHFDRFF